MMHSIRTKITVVAASAIVVTMIIAAAFGVIAIRDTGTESADKQLTLLCETGQKNLDSYFEDVIQSVDTVSAYVEEDMDGADADVQRPDSEGFGSPGDTDTGDITSTNQDRWSENAS